jgi:predicted membrane protein
MSKRTIFYSIMIVLMAIILVKSIALADSFSIILNLCFLLGFTFGLVAELYKSLNYLNSFSTFFFILACFVIVINFLSNYFQ